MQGKTKPRARLSGPPGSSFAGFSSLAPFTKQCDPSVPRGSHCQCTDTCSVGGVRDQCLLPQPSLECLASHPRDPKHRSPVGTWKGPHLERPLNHLAVLSRRPHASAVSTFGFVAVSPIEAGSERKQCNTAISHRTRAALQFLKRNLRLCLDK